MTRLTTSRRTAIAVLTVLCTFLVPSCTRVVDDARGVAAQPGQVFGSYASEQDCTPVDADLVDVPTPAGVAAGRDPVLRIPVPDGWKRISALDSPMIRFVIRAEKLASRGLAPTAVVTLESHRGELSARSFFDEQRRQVTRLGVTDLVLNDTTLCGLPAVRGHYMSPTIGAAGSRRAELLSAVMYAKGRTFGVAVTVQSADENDPDYQRDAAQILDGFQMLPPGAG